MSSGGHIAAEPEGRGLHLPDHRPRQVQPWRRPYDRQGQVPQWPTAMAYPPAFRCLSRLLAPLTPASTLQLFQGPACCAAHPDVDGPGCVPLRRGGCRSRQLGGLARAGRGEAGECVGRDRAPAGRGAHAVRAVGRPAADGWTQMIREDSGCLGAFRMRLQKQYARFIQSHSWRQHGPTPGGSPFARRGGTAPIHEGTTQMQRRDGWPAVGMSWKRGRRPEAVPARGDGCA